MAARPPVWRTAVLLSAMVVLLLLTGYLGVRAVTAPPPSAAATTAIPTTAQPRIFRGPEVQDSATRQLRVPSPKIYRSPHDSP